jgi:hypothetical protein
MPHCLWVGERHEITSRGSRLVAEGFVRTEANAQFDSVSSARLLPYAQSKVYSKSTGGLV